MEISSVLGLLWIKVLLYSAVVLALTLLMGLCEVSAIFATLVFNTFLKTKTAWVIIFYTKTNQNVPVEQHMAQERINGLTIL